MNVASPSLSPSPEDVYERRLVAGVRAFSRGLAGGILYPGSVRMHVLAETDNAPRACLPLNHKRCGRLRARLFDLITFCKISVQNADFPAIAPPVGHPPVAFCRAGPYEFQN